MVGGKIIDWYKRADGNHDFLVRGTGCEENDFCRVTSSIPERVARDIKEHDNIWWQGDFVFLIVFGQDDIPFPKVGAAGGGIRDFYRRRADDYKSLIKTA